MLQYLKDFWTVIRARLARAHKSMTIWFNALAGLLVGALPILQGQLPQLQAYLPANFYQYLMGAVVLANILLRLKTTQALENK